LRRLRSLGYIGGRASEEEEEDEDEPEEEGKNENEGGEDGEEDREREEGKEGEGSKDENRNNKPPMFRPAGPFGFGGQPDWCHTNSIDYNEKLDQIVLGVHTFNEFGSSITARRRKKRPGIARALRHGRRPALSMGQSPWYGAGARRTRCSSRNTTCVGFRWLARRGASDHLQHGMGRTGGRYSSVSRSSPDRFVRPLPQGAGESFGPAQPSWEYTAADKSEFFSGHISGAERLPTQYADLFRGRAHLRGERKRKDGLGVHQPLR
jgi:hypothetical protein